MTVVPQEGTEKTAAVERQMRVGKRLSRRPDERALLLNTESVFSRLRALGARSAE
jgi:hypothetical protein